MGLALHNYHDTNGYFPPGRGAVYNGALNHIQPFMEMQNSVNAYMELSTNWFRHPAVAGIWTYWYLPTHSNVAAAGNVAAQETFDAFICPSVETDARRDRKLAFVLAYDDGTTSPGQREGAYDAGLSTYMPCIGLGGGTTYRGLFVANRVHTISDILDGTSNTLAVGEYLGGPLSAGDSDIYRASWMGGMRMSSLNQPWRQNSSRLTDLPVDRFSSRHPQITQFASADASVRPLRNSVDLWTFRYINGIADGVVSNPTHY
ncbi:MAG: DUF1559 domain-containing protein [Pirellulales bacterium]|nr:DUF1559 domain-containing protein [Pirellulales bacterium]